MQKRALVLLAYDYIIEYRRSGDNANADALLRLPFKGGSDAEDNAAAFQISFIEQLPLCGSDIARETRHDLLLSKMMDLTLVGWPARE